MTRLSARKTRLIVEFSDCVRERGKLREVTMTFTPYEITVRLKGMRQCFRVTPAAIYNAAVLRQVEKLRAERRTRKAKR